MAAENPLMIAGSKCEIPTINSFDLDEAQVLYDYADLTLEDFAPSDDEDEDEARIKEKLRNPGFVRTLMHVAYQRANPKMSAQKVKAAVGKERLIDILAYLAEELGEDDALPPALTTEPEQSSPSDSVESNESSGSDSETSSDGQVVQLTPTGTPGSATSSTPSPQEASGA